MAELVPVPPTFTRPPSSSHPDKPSLSGPLLSQSAYELLYAESLKDPTRFWASYAKSRFYWHSFPDDPIFTGNFDPRKGRVSTQFLPGATTNIAYNCVDRHVQNGLGDRVAFYFESNELVAEKHSVTYNQLLDDVKAFAAALRNLGVNAGDLVTLYLPMTPALPTAMLACARIGAVHSVVFAGFSAESLANRIVDADSAVVVTCDAFYRGAKRIPLKDTVDSAVELAAVRDVVVDHVVVLSHEGRPCTMHACDISWSNAVDSARNAGVSNEVEWVDSEHPLFVLYTSGSTGEPKGIAHATGGYMTFTECTFRHSFAYDKDDVFFCTADCGWITGHSYITYGPLLSGASQVIFEGVPTYPDSGRLWAIVDKFGVTAVYTAPTAVRALKRAGDGFVKKHSRRSLRVLGTVGEPINPEAWRWYFEIVGDSRCPVVDTWWQTETGGHALVPLPVPGGMLKPGAAMRPFFGIDVAVVDNDGNEQDGACEGFLVIKHPWPSALRTIHGDHARMESVYFERFPGYYMTGDGCRRDKDGHYWLTGRIDDVLNVSGHRIGTAEVESAIVRDKHAAEAAVVGVPHDIKGEAIYAFVALMADVKPGLDVKKAVNDSVRHVLGGIAVPETVQFVAALPKTRSGKIMRRILRIIARKGAQVSLDDFGDISTLADPAVVKSLLVSYGQ